MNKKQIQKMLIDDYEGGAPYSRFRVTIRLEDKPYIGVRVQLTDPKFPGLLQDGFSKVCYPDTWDPEYGRDLAVRKALAKLAKRLAS